VISEQLFARNVTEMRKVEPSGTLVPPDRIISIRSSEGLDGQVWGALGPKQDITAVEAGMFNFFGFCNGNWVAFCLLIQKSVCH
jgi:hypothetical protein